MTDPYWLEVYPDPVTGEAYGLLYIDDGETYNYKTQEEYNLIAFRYTREKTLEMQVLHAGYFRIEPFTIAVVSVYGIETRPQTVSARLEDELIPIDVSMVNY